jgi:hypothetical protein
VWILASLSPKQRLDNETIDAAAFRPPHLASQRSAQELGPLLNRRHSFPDIVKDDTPLPDLVRKLANVAALPPPPRSRSAQNCPRLIVIANSAEAAAGSGYAGPHRVGETVPVQRTDAGRAYVSIHDLPPSEVLILNNQPVDPIGDGGDILDPG